MRHVPRRRLWSAAAAILAASAALSATGAPAAQAAPIPAADYQQVSLATGAAELGEPMSLAVLPNRSVIHTARDGSVRVTDVDGNTKLVGKLNVYAHDEEGLQGVAVDPNFATNRHVWLYYSPPLSTPPGDAPVTGNTADFAPWKGHLRLSRFTLNPDDTLNLSSERITLQVDNDRGQCCHVGGDIDFDTAGNLYLTTGDDTNPFESSGYSPIDERTNRNPQFDAQRSSANTNDLRGKLLRIKPQTDGSYTVPAGNLFVPGTPNTRPEIYAMGFRNPFRMSVDKPTGIVYLGDYGPDSGTTDANRGPSGQVEFNRISSPGNYGWPYCTGSNSTSETYNEYTFPSGPSAAKYNCAGGPTNNSFRNTGQTTLPPARAAWIRYSGDAGSPPEFGVGSESPMGGPVYRYNASSTSTVKFPQSMDGRYFAGEYGRRWIKAIAVNADGTPGEISAFPWTGTQVMDMAFGPDGALYVLDYGTGSNNQGLFRIEYIGGGNRNPVAVASANRTSGPSPLTVNFTSAGSADPEGGALSYLWTFGDGTTSTAANPTKTYTANGTYTPTLRVTDPGGLTGTASLVITVGNAAPTINLTTPGNGQLFNFGDTVPYTVSVSDPEDGTINCARVTVTYSLGHDSHAHSITSKTGCSGTITIPVDGEHDSAANIFGVFDASYTDNGGLTSRSTRTLQPKKRQGEHFASQSGVQLADHAPAEGGRTAGYIDNNDWIAYTPYNISNATQISVRTSSAGAGGTIEVHTGSATGPLHGTVTVPVTGSWDTFTNVNANLTGVPAGSTTLYLVFKGGAGALFDIDSFTLTTASAPTSPVVAWRAQVNNQYVTAGTSALIANSITNGVAQRYDLISLGGGNYALRAKVNNMYVCADNAGANPLIANRAAVGPWETFTLVNNSDGSVSLRAQANGRYVTAENAGADPLIANRTAIGPWEKFNLDE
ncbi:PQQ-dependent sugar dehydrogenase [Dactylosporangium sp. NPDC005572]|uniref:PQQ-dependent sugar dehydrogenase n=1 Tax=Dactylosporangium sp. NPDC005572 TaxID=3156889 RepID=UPI0033A51396